MKKSILFLGMISAISFTASAQEQKTTETITEETVILEEAGLQPLTPTSEKTGYEEEILKAEKAKQKAEEDIEKAAKKKADDEKKYLIFRNDFSNKLHSFSAGTKNDRNNNRRNCYS